MAGIRSLPGGGAIVGGGLEYTTGDSDWLFVRLNADGSLDTSFGNNGVSLLDLKSGELMAQFVVSDSGLIHAVGITRYVFSACCSHA